MRRVAIDTLKQHYRVIFDGNGYSADWVTEAARRGLCNYRTTVEALEKADLRRLYVPAGVFTTKEIDSRVNVALEDFVKNVVIELRCLLSIAETQILPALETNLIRVAQVATLAPHFKARLTQLAALGENLLTKTAELRDLLEGEHLGKDDLLEEAKNMQYEGRKLMEEIRLICDNIELRIDAASYPLPTYYDLLFVL
jgi:glutamine synthetase